MELYNPPPQALGVASATSLALGGATIGSNALAVTGTTNLAGTLVAADGTLTMAAGVKLRSTASNNLLLSGTGANDVLITTSGNLVMNNSNVVTMVGGAVAAFTSTATFTSGAAASIGTLTNAPSAGNPTSWIKIIDNGVTRYIPAW